MAIKKGKKLSVITRQSSEEITKSIIKEDSRDIVKSVQEFKTLAEQIAKSTIFIKNFYIDYFRTHPNYKYFDRIKRCDKYFPYARIADTSEQVGLYVDEPLTEQDHNVCLKKAILMRERNLKYVILEEDTDMLNALQQLGVAP